MYECYTPSYFRVIYYTENITIIQRKTLYPIFIPFVHDSPTDANYNLIPMNIQYYNLSTTEDISLINSSCLPRVLVLDLHTSISHIPSPRHGEGHTSYLGSSSLASTFRPAWLPGSVRMDWMVPMLSEVRESGPARVSYYPG